MHKSFLLAEQLGQILTEQNKKITTAESCTGGGIACAITDISGSSGWFERAFITYSNQAKQEMLQVDKYIIEQFGAVSPETAEQMAKGSLTLANADISIAVSGIAGPNGGTKDKPVGTVWFAIAQQGKTETFCRTFDGDRNSIRQKTIETALEKLIECLVTEQ